ncbi:BadM/Rrf2 family transcriptional regulator [Halobacteriovorax marinus]|uniref:Rrf2 family transcriptional regulator n=1 Tax=Halobacteriovorax marinus (strain ATCC BAA-682 / DSM 15412 / SJ) TaxID=862908 RepID=E1X5F6_HALMS|nr:Rrf2 family transcriptional regulator [Halobacteriovorax marinus]ATH08578.1 BadM/Rrf2 family transcriptional regulator [Halobacteriovorax marinus]CBW27277.1 conserved hypothetical protein [Halobacteriovorax marinus SJ]
MKLTTYTDYSIRVLMYLGINSERLCTSTEISAAYGISRNHLSKIIHQLSKLKYIQSYKGASGGITLLEKPKNINLRKLIEQVEPDFDIVECFNQDSVFPCKITPSCKLKSILNSSLIEFLKNLEKYTLADIIENKDELKSNLI